jgi:hypothetical protein
MNFRSPIVGAPIGPKSSRASKTQRFKFEADVGQATAATATRLLFDTSVRMEDIPYGDYFTVEEHWVIQSDGKGVNVNVSMGIRFSKSTLWKAAIESR